MAGIEDLKTDAQIASILKKLKEVPAEKSKPTVVQTTTVATDRALQIPASEVEVQDRSKLIQSPEEAAEETETIANYGFADENILPWFTSGDRDTNLFHYAKFDDVGNLVYSSASADKLNEVASIKLKSDFACDIDYFKSGHYVLFVKQLDSNYSYSRLFTPCDESNNIVVEDTQIISDDNAVTEALDNSLELIKISTDDLAATVAESDKYCHFVVFTDKGIADFIARQDDVAYPYNEVDFNKWFEETSNLVQLKNARFDRNDLLVPDELSGIRDFKYDIITMHRPGIITLDSVDNQDQDYQIHLKLKDEYTFLPLSRVISCLKHYAANKSVDEFRRFVNRYFDVII